MRYTTQASRLPWDGHEQAVGRDPLDVEFGTDPTETPEQLLPRMLDILRVTNRYHLVHVHGQ